MVGARRVVHAPHRTRSLVDVSRRWKNRTVTDIVISGTGLFTPAESISNAELVASLTAATNRWNAQRLLLLGANDVDQRVDE
jgi:hypothetical protein